MKIVAVDVGFISLGLVQVVVHDNFDPASIAVLFGDKIDLRDIPCPVGCTLPHSGNTVDRMTHFTQHFGDMFATADRILIEAQPPKGIRDVQALLYDKYRDKATLVHPASLHKHLGLSRDYDTRKLQTVEIATPFMKHVANFARHHRRHDMADAFSITLYFVEKQREQHLETARREAIDRRASNNRSLSDFAKFRCVAPLKQR